MFNTYTEIRDWLENFIPLVYGKEELGLERIEELLKRLGNPQDKFKSIHVGGTSGKGSTAFYIARLLNFSRNHLSSTQGVTSKNLKVGLHVSPHLSYIGERMQVNGRPIGVRRLIGLIREIRPVVEQIQKERAELTPSYFEILVAASFAYFAQEKVDFAVIEVGLGGRLDATNVLMPEVAVITNVGLDHTEILGNTIEKIAYEKAGIVKRDRPIVTGATGVALDVIKEVAKKNNAPLISVLGIRYKVLGIESHCTNETAGLAIKAVETLGFKVTKEQIGQVFAVGFAGRFEEVEKGVILDGAHNPDKIRSLIEFVGKLKVQSAKCKVILVIGFKKGKDWRRMIDLLIKNLPVEQVIATEFQAVTDTGLFAAIPAEEIAEYAKRKMSNVKRITNSQEAVWEAIETRDQGPETSLVLVTGSLYLVGEVRTMWKS